MNNSLKIIISGLIGFSLITSLVAEAAEQTPSSTTASISSFHARLHTKIPEPPYSQDDVETEIVFGRELASKILGKYPPLHDDALNTYLNKVGQVVAKNSERPELDYHFVVIDTDIINAFAAPGGYVFITRGALNQVQDEAELAAIIAHEIGHVELRHYVKKVGLRSQKGNAEEGLDAILSGGDRAAMQAFNEALDATMEILFAKGLQSKKDEFEADQTSVFLLANAGYDPSALTRYFTRIESIHNASTQTLADTHPPLAERITQMTSLMDKNGLTDLNQAKLQERFNENK